MSRCFVALRPPPEVVEAVAAVRGGETDRLRWSKPADYHVTLRFYPSVDPGELVDAVRALEHPPVEITGGPSVQDMFDLVVALPISGADGLVRTLSEATGQLSPLDLTFRGHLTVGRFHDGAERSFEPRPLQVAWRARSMIVVESVPVRGRFEHVDLAEVPLADLG